MSDDRFDILERLAPLFEVPEPSFERFLRRRDRKRRNQRITAGVVGIALFVTAIWLAAGGAPFDRTQTPAVTGPPAPPDPGELVVSLNARPGTGFPQVFVPVHQVWVYADGRVISRQEQSDGSGWLTGYLEQRLTPEGVERLVTELLSTGLFDRNSYFLSEQGLSWGGIEVRGGDRLVSVVWCCPSLNPPMKPRHFLDVATEATPQQTRDIIRLSDRLTDLASWLPASVWEDAEAMPYVPSRYAVCYRQGPGYSRGLEPSDVLSGLPGAAQDLLGDRDKAYDVFSSRLNEEGPAESDPAICSEVTSEEKRALAQILSDAGFERTPHFELETLEDGQRLWIHDFRAQAPEPIGTFLITFEPILPHGQWSAMAG